MYKPSKPYKQKIIEEIKKTWHTPYVSVHFNTYPIIVRRFDHAEVDHTDGIGTKGVYHWKKQTWRAAVLDALAMNLNDLAIVRAVPYKLSNHITVPEEDVRIFKIIQALAKECRQRKIAIVGGENSFHDTIDGLDISMTISGFVQKPKPNIFRVGDVLIGLKSSGIHSNGFSLVRKLFPNELRSEFTVPTAIYLDNILALLDRFTVHGMMHITGGAFTKLKDILKNADAVIEHPKKLLPQSIFYDIYTKGVSSEVMYTTFNCGIGFVLSVPKSEAPQVLQHLKNAAVIGQIVKGSG
jgi:phosphoribosylformylglycinamidine cyclo-ligase